MPINSYESDCHHGILADHPPKLRVERPHWESLTAVLARARRLSPARAPICACLRSRSGRRPNITQAR